MKILWIAFVWPEPDSSAGGARTSQLLSFCHEAGHQVVVSSPCQSNKYREQLERRGFTCVQFPPNDSGFDAFLREYSPEIVVFDRFMIEEQFSWRVREQCPDAFRILDTIDLHFLRKGRERHVTRGEPSTELSQEETHSSDAIRELSSIYRSDLSFIISETEMDLLCRKYKIPRELLLFVPLSSTALENTPSFQARKNCVTIGNFNHAPNRDSFYLLKDTLWNLIRNRLIAKGVKDPELHLFGAYATAEFLAFDSPATGFRVRGFVPDSRSALSHYRVNLAPLRFGAGVKGKISDGWAGGTPCVATNVAAESMTLEYNGEPVFGGLISDSWEQFADHVTELYLNESRWSAAQQNGFEVLKRRFSYENSRSIFLAALSEQTHSAKEKRLANTIGVLLWYQGARSTEFFSRWIEEKKKRTSSQMG